MRKRRAFVGSEWDDDFSESAKCVIFMPMQMLICIGVFEYVSQPSFTEHATHGTLND